VPDPALLATAMRGVRRLLAGDFAGGLPLLREMVTGTAKLTEPQQMWWITQPMFIALWAGDEQAARDFAEAHVAACRARGVIGALPMALVYLAIAQVFAGRHADAYANANEGLRLSQDTGQFMEPFYRGGILARLAAIEGDQARCETLAKPVVVEAGRQGHVAPLAYAVSALNLLDLGLGRYEEALARLEAVPRGTLGDVIMLAFGVPDQVEAAVRAGAPAKAEALLERYQAWATHSGQSWARAVAHRSQALVHPDQDAKQQYAAALDLHADGRRPFEHARTRLAYGQWLRRNRQRTHARAQLRAAWQTFDHLGAAPWAKQALAELRAAGETDQLPAARPDVLRTLTPQELQVVRLAATGASNRDIAAQLFLSPRTVGYHLYKAFPKLGIASRHELTRLDLDHPEAGDQPGGS
jgi:ATP/maltotriose-dependent transcriptional regulator MalT